MSFWPVILAQTTRPAARPGAFWSFFPFILMGVVIWLLMIRPRRTEQQKHRAMIDTLKKGDRVMTIGGILGVVAQVRDDEITLKVDESTNAKLTFTRSAIKSVLSSSNFDDKKP